MAHKPKPRITAAKGTAAYIAQRDARRAWHREHGGIKKKTDVKKTKNTTNNNKVYNNLEQYILTSNLDDIGGTGGLYDRLARPMDKGGQD